MNRQRGFFGLGLVGSLIGYAVIAGVAGTAIYAFDKSRQKIGEQRIEEKYAPLYVMCDAFPAKGFFGGDKKSEPDECAKAVREKLALGDQALVANDELKGKFKTLQGERDQCSATVKTIAQQSARAATEAARRKPEDEKKLAAIAVDKQALIDSLPQIDALGLLPEPKTCEQRLARAEQRIARRDALWAKVAREQERDFPPTAEPAPAAGLRLAEPPEAKPPPLTEPRKLVNPLRPK